MTRPLVRLGMIGALAAALLLSGCGRKGALDPPPGSSLQQEPVEPTAAEPGSPPMRARREFDEAGRPISPKGPKRHLFLDFLLD